MFEQKHFYYAFAHTPTNQARQHWMHVHSVGWVACRSDYDIERRAYFDYQLLYVIRGVGHVQLQDGAALEASSGDVILLDLNERHRYFSDKRDPWEVIWVHFGGAQAAQYHHHLQALTLPITQTTRGHGRYAQSRLFKRIFELFRQPDLPKLALDAQANSLVTRILSDLVVARVEAAVSSAPLPATYDSPDAIRQGIEYMEERYHHPLSLQEIAHHASLSPYHFAREFKRITDYSVMGYLHEFRMSQAKRLLRESHLSIREVGEAVGFPDQSYFSLRFKQHEQMTPSEYRTTFLGDVGLPDDSPEALREHAMKSEVSDPSDNP